jgi:hypothetical protein
VTDGSTHLIRPSGNYYYYCHDLRGLFVTYKTGFGFIDTLLTQLGTTGNYSAIADIHTLQFKVTHALGFSDFSSRILAKDLLTVVIPVSLQHT